MMAQDSKTIPPSTASSQSPHHWGPRTQPRGSDRSSVQPRARGVFRAQPGTATDTLDTRVMVPGHRLPDQRKSHKMSSADERETFHFRQQGHLNLICVPRHWVLRDATAFTRRGGGSVQH